MVIPEKLIGMQGQDTYVYAFLEGKEIIFAFLCPAKFLWLPKNVRTPTYSYLQALLVKHAIDRCMKSSKIIQT